MRKGLLSILAVSFLFAAAASLTAEGKGYSHQTLENGLELFVVENDAVPLVTIMISFRCGAIAQTEKTAGLFHLYEHMLFAGNSKYPTQAAFLAALNKMGVANWNGGTSNEYVNYYITIPSERLADGLEFWSSAVREPSFDPKAFEGEKDVVKNEIRGNHSDPEDIFSAGFETRAFIDFPWRKDISGPEANIDAATLTQMKEMKDTFYIPSNAAILVGGAVKKAEATAYVKKYFGTWKGGNKPEGPAKPHGTLSQDSKFFYADENFYSGIGLAEMTFRGPDVLTQTADTYAADVLLFLLSSPVGTFKNALMEKVPGLYDPEYISINYPTQRDGGQFYFSTHFVAEDPAAEGPVLERMEGLKKTVAEEFALIAKDPAAYFTAKELEAAKTKLIDSNVLSSETAPVFLSTLNFWWSTASADYFFTYEDNCRKVSFQDIARLLDTYLVGKPTVVGIRFNTELLSADGKLAAQAKEFGYGEVAADNAFWWQK